jgi:hypothetical protein
MPVLRIVRERQTMDRLRDYKIKLDGKSLGGISNGLVRLIEIAPGTHRLTLRIDWAGSATLEFAIADDETVEFTVSPNVQGVVTVFDMLLRLLFSWNTYLLLRETRRFPTDNRPDIIPLPPAEAPAATSHADPAGELSFAMQSLLRVIQEKKKTDPLIGPKIGGKEIYQTLLNAAKTEKGVHAESLFTALGALAGYACQASVREFWVNTGKMPEQQVFTIISTRDGRRFFFGDYVNQPLAENQHSVWGMAAGMAQHLGCTTLPDINEMFKTVSASVGTERFGLVQPREGVGMGDTPINCVKALWQPLLPKLKLFADTPTDWPITLAFAIQEAMVAAKSVLAPDIALCIVMESAIPMSKIDLPAY